MDLVGPKSFLLSKAKSLMVSFFSFWSTRSTLLISPNPKPFSALQRDHLLGLKTLAGTEAVTPALLCRTVHNHTGGTTRISKPPPPPPKTTPRLLSFSCDCQRYCSEMMDDLIGTDSGVHMVTTSSDDGEQITRNDIKRSPATYTGNYRIRDRRRHEEERYPPPIASAATGNLRRRTMPWVLTRRYCDGRLVIEGRLRRRHEHFEARREDGRLILNLVSTGVEDHDHDKDDDVLNCNNGYDQKQGGLFYLESSNSGESLSSSAYACGMFMDSILLCNASNTNVPSSAALVRPMTSVIV